MGNQFAIVKFSYVSENIIMPQKFTDGSVKILCWWWNVRTFLDDDTDVPQNAHLPEIPTV